jgi:CRISPR system Cascade subunit CasA
MNKAFNLLDEPWLPVQMEDGALRHCGLLELFSSADEIRTVAETAPPTLVALYRLLVVVVHRALAAQSPHWTNRQVAAYFRTGLPVDVMRAYLERWRERFYLFHPDTPFMQVTALADIAETRDKLKPWTQIALDSVVGNAPTVFDHAVDSRPDAIPVSLALRHLLGFLQSTPGGLVKCIRDSDNAGAVSNTAVVLPQGRTVGQTLCLLLHPPTRIPDSDRPAWELPPPQLADLKAPARLATGPNDRYTRLTRAVLFDRDEEHPQHLKMLRFAAGLALAEDEQNPDPMASYRAGSVGMVRVSFVEGRAFWRDLGALLPDTSGVLARPAAVLAHAADVQEEAADATMAMMPVLVAGIASNQAKLLRWRVEQVALPPALLTDPARSSALRACLKEAEETFADLRRIAATMFAGAMPDPDHKDTRSRARDMVANGASTAAFFSRLERHLPILLATIGRTELDQAYRGWQEAQRAALTVAWAAACQELAPQPHALRAQARASDQFAALMSRLRPDPATSSEEPHQ